MIDSFTQVKKANPEGKMLEISKLLSKMWKAETSVSLNACY
jgi:hypothetical protein